MEEKEIDGYLLEEHLFVLFCAQMVKDFEVSGVDSTLISGLDRNPIMAKAIVLGAVKTLAQRNGEGLRRLLYRVDISEQQLRKYQAGDQQRTFEETVAELIVKRILQKVIIRKKMSDG